MVLRSSLYAILDLDLTLARGLAPLDVAAVWLDAGVRLVQLRAKHATTGALLTLADQLARRAEAAGAQFIVNDRADVALMCGAAGVHLGQGDLTPHDARRVVGRECLIGRSTHNDMQLVRALLEPIDYVAIGPVFETQSKVQPDPVVGLAGVADAAVRARAAHRPLVAIGGITLETAPDVLAAGASGVAVISDLLIGDLNARARSWVKATQLGI